MDRLQVQQRSHGDTSMAPANQTDSFEINRAGQGEIVFTVGFGPPIDARTKRVRPSKAT